MNKAMLTADGTSKLYNQFYKKQKIILLLEFPPKGDAMTMLFSVVDLVLTLTVT